jgi:predicted outer membrane repeat protein
MLDLSQNAKMLAPRKTRGAMLFFKNSCETAGSAFSARAVHIHRSATEESTEGKGVVKGMESSPNVEVNCRTCYQHRPIVA